LRESGENNSDDTTRLNRTQWTMLVIMTMSSFVVVLDFASIFIPLPTIMEDLDGTLDEATWVITAFILAFAVFLLPSSKFANNHGRRRLFLYGVTVSQRPRLHARLHHPWGF